MICVCVAEGKKGSITHGVAQTFAQLSAVQQTKENSDHLQSLGVHTGAASISKTYVVDPRDPASIKKMIIRAVMLLLRHCMSWLFQSES